MEHHYIKLYGLKSILNATGLNNPNTVIQITSDTPIKRKDIIFYQQQSKNTYKAFEVMDVMKKEKFMLDNFKIYYCLLAYRPDLVKPINES